MQKDNINRPAKGLHLDNSYIDTPKDTYRFALNSTTETELGDFAFIGNEESNSPCANFPIGFTPIGKEYIGDGRTVIFLVNSNETVSEIGIYDDTCKYETHVNDSTSEIKDKLNFKISKQINATYRLRRGCERTIYWVDDYNKPRYYNFDKPQNFKNTDGTWSSNKFNLQKTYSKIPAFQKIEVLDSGGNLEAGSYNIAIQYVDESLNPTEWITTSGTIKIYNDLQSKTYREINGSINSDSDYINFPKTSKAIKVQFSNLDSDFLYYRLAIIESNNGSGNINRVFFTETIPTSKTFFIYTGNNATTIGTQEEVLQAADIIEKAGSIEQIENRLLLANTQGKQVNFCKLQKYASRIKADCITKQVVLNDITDPSNPKNPVHEIGGLGYMPGEIYSFGIVYIFEDGSLSPVFHIPGRNPSINKTMVFNPSENTYPMSKDNHSENTTYNDNDNCENQGYWGLDSEGQTLDGKYVRHHRFPLRNEINKPLVVDELGEVQTANYYQLILKLQGTLRVPCDKNINPECVSELPDFEIRVTYKLNEETFSFIQSVNPDLFANGINQTYNINLLQNSQFHSDNTFTDITFSVTDINGNYQAEIPITLDTSVTTSQDDIYFTDNATYTVSSQPYSSVVQGRLFTTEILGIKFSGIDIPSIGDTNGEKIIGYYIVRNERTEFDKTILDTGVLVPCVVNTKYISHGLLQPETNKISESVYGLIHPEHKFQNKEYVNYDKIIQQGNYNIVDRKLGKINYDDVYNGSSYQSKSQREGNDDGQTSDGSPTSRGYDGWSLNIITRDNIVSYKSKKSFEINNTQIKDRFYLDALGYKSINDNANDVYNIACDNKIGIVELKQGTTIPSGNNLPYVALYKKNSDPYSNFRVLPYYKENLNPIYFNFGNSSVCSVYNGDTYVTPMKYVNTMYYDNRVARRSGKRSILKTILGAALVVLGAVLAFIPGVNASSVFIIGAGIALIGAGILCINSGIKIENFNRAYNEEYNKGLRQTTLDSWVDMFYNYKNTIPFGFNGGGESGQDGPSDDTIQWLADCITDIWCESTVNMSLRNHFVIDTTPTYMDAPGRIENGNNSSINTWEFFGIMYTNSNSQRYPVSNLERHVSRKLVAFDQTRDDNKYYIGLALGEYYNINPDYLRKNKQKIYYHLPLEYDCCIECKEDFPHRIHYSEQSYQEELSDNYRIFLPNNYKDLEGETGYIVNLFRLGNDLFVHTKEALWQMPRNYQERVTDQIISFIGTGSYFEIPPRKVLDDDTGSSAGCQHKWSSIKIPNGYFFITENQRKFYRFDGSKLAPISSQGLYNWFFNNIPVRVDEQYYKNNSKLYPFKDNPSNNIGTGFITTYDSQKERILLSKKDFILSSDLGEGYELCTNGSSTVIFPNINNTIAYYHNLGWNYVGIDSCRLKFEKTTIKTRVETRIIEESIFRDSDYLVFKYNFTGTEGTDLDTRTKLLTPVVVGPYGFGSSQNTNASQGTIFDMNNYLNWSGDNTGTGLESIMINIKKIKQDFPLATELKFNAAAWWFINNPDGGNMNMNAESYKGGEMTIIPRSNPNSDFLFKPINGGILQGTYSFPTKFIPKDPVGQSGVPEGAANQIGIFTYRFEDGDLSWDGESGGSTPPEVIKVETEVTVSYLETEYTYVYGEDIENPMEADNSWTISYSLKQNTWTSWHSYLPSFYINTPSKWFSWKLTSNNNIWKHNIKGNYQTYYNKYYPHILEYISLSSPLTTRTWNHLRLLTEAKKFDNETKEYCDVRFTTFNKVILYNSRQCSGLLDLVVKDTTLNQQNYLAEQVLNLNNNSSTIDRTERDWLINDFRDMREDYTKPIWNSNIYSFQNEYFIDKILNHTTINMNKNWTQLESFRDKYLAVRLIFDKFADIKLITNYSVENEQQSLF